MKRLLILGSVILLTSCSASWHVKKAMKKDPSLFSDKATEVIDTVIVEVPKVDTVLKFVKDEVVQIEQTDKSGNEVKIKYLYNTITDSIYIEADCPDQQVITKDREVVKTIVLKPTFWERIRWTLAALIIVAVVIIILKIVRKFS